MLAVIKNRVNYIINNYKKDEYQKKIFNSQSKPSKHRELKSSKHRYFKNAKKFSTSNKLQF